MDNLFTPQNVNIVKKTHIVYNKTTPAKRWLYSFYIRKSVTGVFRLSIAYVRS